MRDEHEQTRDDPPHVSDESAFLDLNDFAAERNTALENHNKDDDPDDDDAGWSPFGTPPPGAHLLTTLPRRMRWQRSRATMSQLQRNAPSGLGFWVACLMARWLRAGRHGLFFNVFFI